MLYITLILNHVVSELEKFVLWLIKTWNEFLKANLFWDRKSQLYWFLLSKIFHHYKPYFKFFVSCYSFLYFLIYVINFDKYFPKQFWLNTLPGTSSGFLFLEQSRRVLTKRCPENMQQIYGRTPIPKCDFNKAAKQLYWNHFLAWVLYILSFMYFWVITFCL